MASITIWAAFLAGLASFISPCILPLVPVYLSVLGGGTQSRAKVMWRSFGFVLGFTAVFILLGAAASFLGGFLRSVQPILRRLGGLFMVVMGVHLTGLLPISLLNREARMQLDGQGQQFGGSFIMGMAFALGWTPCIGPVLASILVFAGTSQTVLQGVILLLWYSLGIAIPLLIVAALAGVLTKRVRGWAKYGEVVAKISGVILIAIGILLFFNKLGWLVSLFS